MKTAEYWAKRAEMRMDQGMAAADAVVRELDRLYRSAERNVDYEIKRLFERYGQEYGLSYADAIREIAASEYKEWRMTLAEYVERINATGDEELLRELDILSTRSRATRWQQVETAIKVNASELAAKQESLVRDLLGDQYRRTYYGQIFDIHKGMGYGSALEMLSSRRVAEVAAYPWSGANYSERVWRNRDALTNNLRDTLTEGLIQGADTKQMAQRIRDSMEVSMHRAQTLVRTETAHVIEKATMDGYGEAEVEEYEILATLDRRTSRVCQQQDGKRYKVSEAVEGKNMPPFHPNCRTTTVPVISENEGEGQRAARDADGKRILVPADMKYEQWYEEFVQKPEFKQFEDAEDWDSWLNQDGYEKRWIDSLTEREKSAVLLYTGDVYVDINDYLRHGRGNKELLGTVVESIDSAIGKFDLKGNIQVFRSVDSNAFGDTYSGLAKWAGMEYTDLGYMSSTPIPNSGALYKECLMEIKVPKGKGRGAYINSLSEYKDEEYEFLLKRGTRCKVHEVDLSGSTPIIRMEVIVDDERN